MIFKSLEQGESKLRYWLEDKIEGLEIFLDEKNIKAKSLWKNGDDFRVLVLDEKQQKTLEKDIQKQREAARKSLNIDDFDDYSAYYERFSEMSAEIDRRQLEQKYNAYQWRSIKDRKLAGKTTQPAEDFSIVENGQFPDIDYLTAPDSVWKARTSGFELRSGDYEKDGIYKVARNGLVTQINDNSSYLDNPVVSADGKWALITKREENYYINNVYRLNLQTGKDFKIKLPKTLTASPLAFIKPHNKFLVYTDGAEDFDESIEYIFEDLKEEFTKEELKNLKPAYYLVDANTGTFKEVKGEFTPFRQITFRNLQKTSNPDEFWAAIYDESKKATKIGRYDAKNFKFKEEMTIPEIALDSMNIWVDEPEAIVYFIYEGHLLSLPLKKP